MEIQSVNHIVHIFYVHAHEIKTVIYKASINGFLFMWLPHECKWRSEIIANISRVKKKFHPVLPSQTIATPTPTKAIQVFTNPSPKEKALML
jgi:hypothetical protein